MFHRLSTIFICVIAATPLFSSEIIRHDITVGAEPSVIYTDAKAGRAHVICTGYDKNFNGIFEPDSGDVKPSWWVIENSGSGYTAKMVKEFDFASLKYPLKPAFSSTDRKIWINQNGRVVPYDIDTYSPIQPMVIETDAAALARNGNYLFICTNETFGEPGSLKVLDADKKVLNTIPAKLNVQDVATYPTSGGKIGLAVMSVGKYGSDSSILQIGEYDFKTVPDMKEIVVGRTANHVTTLGNLVAVTVNGSHKVIIINSATKEIEHSIDTKTTGWDGPRETIFIPGGKLYVSTYAGDVRKYNLADGSMTDSIGVHGKPDGMAYISKGTNAGILFVANSLDQSYGPDSTVTILEESTVGVEETISAGLEASIAPNPAADHFSLNGNIEAGAGVEIYNLDGRLAMSTIYDGNAINAASLESGCYYAKIKSGRNEAMLPLRIIK